MTHDILIVDDEADIRALIAGILQDEGYSTREAGTADEALAALSLRRPSLIIQDIWLQGSNMDGIGILEVVQRDHPDVPVVMISGHGTIETAVQAIKIGAYDFIEKPFQTDRLLIILDRAIEAARLKRENRELRLRAGHGMGAEDDLVGTSAAITHLRNQITKIAPSNSRVLIEGGPGVGKEVVARLIHNRSHRKDGPFVILNCAAMHPDRMEIELFGTDSDEQGNRRVGTFEQAHGGTLLLDEVADMPIETQAKIMRALQEQSFLRVGSQSGQRVEVDVRVLASSNRDLQVEIMAGRFREDLYYRLGVVPVYVPSLRDRRDDIPLLVNYFMALAAQTAGVPPRSFGEDALLALQSYPWPGNIRQLRNVIDWLLIMAPGGENTPIRADMLPVEITAISPAVLHLNKANEFMEMPMREARELFEKEYLILQVRRFNGSISRTASFIGMERSALHRKLRTLGIAGLDDKNAQDERATP